MSGAAVSAVIARYERGGFAWGERDCLRFALECAAAAGRADLTPLLPPYGAHREAMRAMRARGLPSLIDLMDAHATPIRAGSARTGDVAYLDQAPSGCLGTVVGGEAVFLTRGGFVRRPTSKLLLWRLPNG
jgi:hypothetical protein